MGGGQAGYKGSPAQGPGGVPSHGGLRQDPRRRSPLVLGEEAGVSMPGSEGPSAVPPAAQEGDSAGDASAVESGGVGVWWAWPGGEPSHPAARRGLHLPHVPQAAPAGLGRAPAGTGALGAGEAGPGRPPCPSLPQGGATPAPSPPPPLTDPRGRSCLPRSPAPPVGTGVSPGQGAPSADPPRGARAERPATHLRQLQERRQQQEPAVS